MVKAWMGRTLVFAHCRQIVSDPFPTCFSVCKVYLCSSGSCCWRYKITRLRRGYLVGEQLRASHPRCPSSRRTLRCVESTFFRICLFKNICESTPVSEVFCGLRSHAEKPCWTQKSRILGLSAQTHCCAGKQHYPLILAAIVMSTGMYSMTGPLSSG